MEKYAVRGDEGAPCPRCSASLVGEIGDVVVGKGDDGGGELGGPEAAWAQASMNTHVAGAGEGGG